MIFSWFALVSCCGGSDDLANNSNTNNSSSLAATSSFNSFALNGVAGSINLLDKSIGLVMPYGTDLSLLTETFSSSGTKVQVAGITQVSGASANNFTSPVSFVVTAEDGSISTFIVTTTVAPSNSQSLTSFSLSGISGSIQPTTHTITVTLPFGTAVSNLIATFNTTGSAISVSGVPQVSGATAVDFTTPVVYVVTAADASSSSYTVTVSVAASSAKTMTNFALNGVSGVINDTNKTISLTLPYGTNVTGLIATFTTTASSVKVAGLSQVSTTNANDFSGVVSYVLTAADASTFTYAVTVQIAPSDEKSLTSFAIDGVAGTIDLATNIISVVMPHGTDLSSLIDTFVTTGSSVRVGTTLQFSGVSFNNFSAPIVFIVKAADATTKSYTVNASVTAAGPPNVSLGNAGNFVLFADTGMSSSVNSAITGNVGVGPSVTSTAITTGFTLTTMGSYATAPQVSGNIYAIDYTNPTPAFIVSAHNDMLSAFNDAKRRTNPDFTNLGGGNVSGLTLSPGLYKWTNSVTIDAGSTLTFNGSANDVWILQIAGTCITGAASSILLTGGALPQNIIWQLDTALTLGAATDFKGIVLAGSAITLGANNIFKGRLLAQTAITLNADTISAP